MTQDTFRNNFGEWLNEPVVQKQVLAYMHQLDHPMLLRDIYRPLGIPKEHVNRVLGRLHAKGVLTRYKIPVTSHRPGQRGQRAETGGAMRKCFLYSLAEYSIP